MQKKYHFTNEMDARIKNLYWKGGKCRARSLAREFGYPIWTVKRRAGRLGVTRPVKRRDWTDQEVAFLRTNISKRTARWIAKELGRSEASVVLKIKRLNISRRMVRDGYSLRQLVVCFGEDHKKIRRWVEAGWLKMNRIGTRRQNDFWYVTEADLLAFIRKHRDAYQLHKVDQQWFLSLVLGEGETSRKCCLCLRLIEGVPVPERRPTGENGELETWWYCRGCKAA